MVDKATHETPSPSLSQHVKPRLPPCRVLTIRRTGKSVFYYEEIKGELNRRQTVDVLKETTTTATLKNGSVVDQDQRTIQTPEDELDRVVVFCGDV